MYIPLITVYGCLLRDLEIMHGYLESQRPPCGRLPIRNRSRRPLRSQESRHHTSMHLRLRYVVGNRLFSLH